MSAIKKIPLIAAAFLSASAWASVEITGFSVSEAAGTGTWNVTAQVGAGAEAPAGVGVDYQVDYQTRDGTAQDENGDDDYKAKSGTLDFTNNLTQQITVTIVQDGTVEGDEYLFVDLYEVPPEVPAGDAPQGDPIETGTGNIIDDDIELVVNVVFEGGGGGPVDILLECGGNGTITDDTLTTVGNSATFEVINFVEPLDCTAVPTSTPSGTSLTSSDCNPGMDEADTECVMVFAPSRTTFLVTKEFTDGDNPTEVDVTINCFTGLPIEQSQTIDETQGVEFVVTDFDSGELDCDITEEDLNGYTPTYQPGGPGTFDANGGCNFDNVEGGTENTCHIVNDADPVDVVIEKVWVIEGASADQVDTSYKLTLYCDAQITDASYCHSNTDTVESPTGNGSSWECKKNFYGDGSQVFTGHVTPEYPNSHCWVEEEVYDSSVEIDNDCGNLVISAGTGDSCVITNTVFFEGIPTLSQYGLAIMALLMLGVGLLGFRRFA